MGLFEKPPAPQPIPARDPLLDAQAARAEQQNVAALTQQAQGDTASLMARYGTRLALAGQTTGSPLSITAVAGSMGKAA